ncbi:MAG: threonylcarbamoyl-AMP synthase [Synergistaceae bacterium]|jgi:L-threonylcarbamoyladenylate synthase|nr:threonylcarbamoyl-AMP synthase [Synergistaceae bacterium]
MTAKGRIVPATEEYLMEASLIIRRGGLVAFPTETVYGLGANALDSGAVKGIFAAKGRPQDNPLIVHVSGARQAAEYAEVGECALKLMDSFWPGPLSIVLYSTGGVPDVTRAGLDTVALRVPRHPVALSLIEKSGVPIAAPSANRSGRPSPTSAGAVADDLGSAVDLIIDGGPTFVGLESTVVDATRGSAAILRPGCVTREMLARVVGLSGGGCGEIAHRSPGTRHRHYAPDIPLFLWDGTDRAPFREASGLKWCYMGTRTPPRDIGTPHREIIFSSLGEYARGLFARLREFEASGAEMIIAQIPEEGGIGSAIRNRLGRAAE